MSRVHGFGHFEEKNPTGFPILPYGARVRHPGFKHEEGSGGIFTILGLERRGLHYHQGMNIECYHYMVQDDDVQRQTVFYIRMDDIHLCCYLILDNGEEVKLGKCGALPKPMLQKMLAHDSTEKNQSHLKERPWRYGPANMIRSHLSLSGLEEWKKKIPKVNPFCTKSLPDVIPYKFGSWQNYALFLKSYSTTLSAADVTTILREAGFPKTEPKVVKNFLAKNKDRANAFLGWDISKFDVTKCAFLQLQARYSNQNRSCDETIRDVCFAGVVCGNIDFLKKHWNLYKHDRGCAEGMAKQEWPEWCDSVMEVCLNIARKMGDQDIIKFLATEQRSMKLNESGMNQDLNPFCPKKPLEGELLTYSRGIVDLFSALDMSEFERKKAKELDILVRDIYDGRCLEDRARPASEQLSAAEKQIPDDKKALLVSALNHFLEAVNQSFVNGNPIVGVEAMAKSMDILATSRKTEKVANVLSLFKDRILYSNSLMRPWMVRRIVLDCAVFHHRCYRIADARMCLDAVTGLRQDEMYVDVRTLVTQSKICMDLGDYKKARDILEKLVQMKWFELDVGLKGTLGCWDPFVDPSSEARETQAFLWKTEVALLMIFTFSDMGKTAEAEAILDDDFQYVAVGHQQMAMELPVGEGYRGPLDQESIHRMMMNNGAAPKTQRDIAEDVAALDKAGHKRTKMSAGVKTEEVDILRMWIRMRDVKNDTALIDTIDKSFRTKYGTIEKVRKVFEKSFLKSRRYNKLWCEIMAIDARRQNKPQNALQYYRLVLENEWCHVAAYNLLSVARALSEEVGQKEWLHTKYPYEMKTHQYFPLLYIENEMVVCADHVADGRAQDYLLTRINMFSNEKDTILWKFKMLVAYANLKQAKDWHTEGSEAGKKAALKLVNKSIATQSLPEARVFLQMLQKENAPPTADPAAENVPPQDPSGPTANKEVLPTETISEAKPSSKVDVSKSTDGEDVRFEVKSSEDFEWLLAQVRIDSASDEVDEKLDEIFSRMTKEEHSALWKHMSNSIQNAVVANRPVVDINGREMIPRGFYEWNLGDRVNKKRSVFRYEKPMADTLLQSVSREPSKESTTLEADSSGKPLCEPEVSDAPKGVSDSDKSCVRAVYEQDTYFAVIGVDTNFYDEYKHAIERKGFSAKKHKSNGILFERSMVKVKINRDQRIWSNVVYKNAFNNYLIHFQKEDGHSTIVNHKKDKLRYESV